MNIEQAEWPQPESMVLHPARSFRIGVVKCSEGEWHPTMAVNDQYAVTFNSFDEAEEYLKSLRFSLAEIRLRYST
jgi:hypothetical protein